MMLRLGAGVGIGAGIAALGAWSWISGPTSALAGEAQAETAKKISAEELVRNTFRYVGQRVTVRAKVDDVYSSHTFTLDEDAVFAGPDVLVLVPNAVTAPDDKSVTVTGRVRRYVSSEFDRDYDWFDARPDWEGTFRDRAVIVADSVKTEDGRELVKRSAMSSAH
jgi:hypothetical protein